MSKEMNPLYLYIPAGVVVIGLSLLLVLLRRRDVVKPCEHQTVHRAKRKLRRNGGVYTDIVTFCNYCGTEVKWNYQKKRYVDISEWSK